MLTDQSLTPKTRNLVEIKLVYMLTIPSTDLKILKTT